MCHLGLVMQRLRLTRTSSMVDLGQEMLNIGVEEGRTVYFILSFMICFLEHWLVVPIAYAPEVLLP